MLGMVGWDVQVGTLFPMPQNKLKCVWDRSPALNELLGIFSVVSPSHSLAKRDWYKLENVTVFTGVLG